MKTEVSYDFADNMHKKVNAVIEDKLAGGIEEGGKITWENSPGARNTIRLLCAKPKSLSSTKAPFARIDKSGRISKTVKQN